MWPINWPGNVRVVFEETTAVTGDGHQALAFSLGLRSRPHWVRFAGFVTCCTSLSDFCYTALGPVQRSRLGWTLQFVMEDSWWILDSFIQ